MKKTKIFLQHISYLTARFFLWPIRFMPLSWIHALGKQLGNLAYYLCPTSLRKTTYNNLALAKTLKLSNKDIKRIARKSFQNLVIVALEYFILKKYTNHFDEIVQAINLEPLHQLIEKGQGVIAVTGHLANWELCFLHYTQKYPSVTVGKPIHNKRLYHFIQSIRTMHKGRVILGQNALSIGQKVLKEGHLFSMVNDQSFTSSFYSYPFLGTRAFTSPSPALLAYRTKSPIVVVTTKRDKGKYTYFVSDPIWPNREKRIKDEVPRLMDEIMSSFEKHLMSYPDQWLWQHKRWKQEGFHRIYKPFKADSILFILPNDPALFKKFKETLYLIPQIYTRSFLTFLVPKAFEDEFSLKGYEVYTYTCEKELLLEDYRFQLVFNFNPAIELKRHYLKWGAKKVFSLKDLYKRVHSKFDENFDPEFLFKSIICLSNTPFQPPLKE